MEMNEGINWSLLRLCVATQDSGEVCCIQQTHEYFQCIEHENDTLDSVHCSVNLCFIIFPVDTSHLREAQQCIALTV